MVKARVKSARTALWQMRRLKDWGLDRKTLRLCYQVFVRSRLEYGIPAIRSRLTDGMMDELEAVERTATKIALGTPTYPFKLNEETGLYEDNPDYIKYEDRCTIL